MCIDSGDAEIYQQGTGLRIGDSTPSQININPQRPLLFGYMTRLSLTEVNMEWNIPNVNSTNNTLTIALFDLSGALQSSVRISITNEDGLFLTLPGIVKAVVDRLNTDASDGGLIQFKGAVGGDRDNLVDVSSGSPSTNVLITIPRVEIEQDTPSLSTRRFQIIPYDATVVVDGLGISHPVGLPILSDDLTNMLGLTPTRQPILPCPTSYFGGYASAMYTPYIDIESTILTKNQNVQDGTSQRYPTSSKLARIYLAPSDPLPRQIVISFDASGNYAGSSDNAIGTNPFVLRREFQTPKVISWNNTENVDNVDLKVIDYRGNRLPIEQNIKQDDLTEILPGLILSKTGNTADFQFTIMATEI